MSDSKMKVRSELKYYISYAEYYKLKSIIKHTMRLDLNSGDAGYHIRSLYFDDGDDSALFEKNFGINVRKKFRVRIYNRSDKIIKLERKRKFTNHTNKEDFSLSKETFQRILDHDVDFLLKAENNVAEEFYYDYQNLLLRPKVIVDYFREPFVMKAGDVRITFDKNLSASSFNGDLFGDLIGRKILESGVMILEVKYTHFLPDVIKLYLSMIDKKPLSVSKYVLCREKIIFNEWGI